MDKLRALETFVAIADRGSLTKAADTLDVSLPTVVRVLAELEVAVGARLFNRTTRRIHLTDEGARYLASCRLALGQLKDAEADLARSRELEGVLADYEPAPLPVSIVYPHARLLAATVRAFVDLAAERLRGLDFAALGR